MGEVEQRTGGHHRVVGVAAALGGRQEAGIERLDLRQMRRQLFGQRCCGTLRRQRAGEQTISDRAQWS